MTHVWWAAAGAVPKLNAPQPRPIFRPVYRSEDVADLKAAALLTLEDHKVIIAACKLDEVHHERLLACQLLAPQELRESHLEAPRVHNFFPCLRPLRRYRSGLMRRLIPRLTFLHIVASFCPSRAASRLFEDIEAEERNEAATRRPYSCELSSSIAAICQVEPCLRHFKQQRLTRWIFSVLGCARALSEWKTLC
jgi:hypothetical protein